jgi:putative membrane protein
MHAPREEIAMKWWALLADWDNGRMMDHQNGMGWWWLVGLLVLGVLIATVVLVIWLVTRAGRPGGPTTASDPTSRGREILAERLARGEIDPAEYQERLSHLR